MTGRTRKRVKKLVCAGILAFALAGASEARAGLIFQHIPVKTGPAGFPAIWGNYIVWKGAQNEAYDIAQRQIVHMPGLNIDGEPAIWGNKVVYEGANGYYDLDLQQMVYPTGLSVGNRPAMHNNRVVWNGSTGYYDLNLQQIIEPAGLSIGDGPDIFGDKIVWPQSIGYYDIDLEQMVYPDGLSIGWSPAIYDNKIAWQSLPVSMGYYDIDLQQYVSLEGAAGVFCSPDIFEDSFVWNNYDAIGPIIIDVFVWDPVNKQTQVTESGCAAGAKIYNDIVVWTDWRNENGDIYMAVIPEPSTMVLLGTGLAGLLSCTKRKRNYH